MPPTTITRRILLRDLGRMALGAVVVGTAVGCSSDADDTAADASASPSGADGSAAPSASGSPASSGSPSDGQAAGELAWERASFGFVSAYVLVRDGEALVLDTGTSDGGLEPIAAALEAAGVGWGDVSTVLATHDHGDHIGGAGAVMGEATNATAYAAEPDLSTLRQRVEGAQAVSDGDTLLGGATVVATPGHTPGHVSLHDPSSGLLLAGDAIVNGVQIGGTSGDGIEVSPPEFTADADAARSSVQVLADLGPATLLFGHGEPITSEAAAQLREYAGTL